MKKWYGIVIGRQIWLNGTPLYEILVHELVHQVQMTRDGVFRFYFKYVWFFVKGFCVHRSFDDAYHSIPYEIEAYEYQGRYAQSQYMGIDGMIAALEGHLLR